MAVTRADKEAELQLLEGMFHGADAAILIDYKGINVPQVTELRRELKKASAGTDVAAINQAMEALTKAQHAAAETLYKHAQSSGGGGEPGGGT